jgi:peptidylprolyl isomerase
VASDPKNTPAPGGPQDERAKMMRVLIPAGAIALVVIVVAVIASGFGSGRKMSDGSDGSAEDPDLKEAAPGVKFRDLKEGQGNACTPGSKVKINYTGWLRDGTVFDSSKGNSVEFDLNGLIAGWQIGIPGMKPGGIRKLVIAPEKGYANQAKPGIPPGSTLIFEVELLESVGPRPRRSPAPADLTKLADGTSPTTDDPDVKSLGSGGLLYRDIKVGDGPEVKAGATVVVDYIGWLRSDGKMFDSSWKEGRGSFTRSLVPGAPNGVIPGWQQGMVGMKVGGIRKLVIPPELAYAAGGTPDGAIPPNATLVFEVELLWVK